MTKRFVAVVVVMALIMTMFILPNTAGAIYEAYSCCGNGKALNVREGPGKEYRVIGKIPYGEMTAVDHDLGNGWSEVYVGSQNIGYAMTSLMSKSQPGPYVPPTPKPGGTTATDDYNALFNQARLVKPYTVTLNPTANSKGAANVRWAPNKKATLLARYNAGSEVTVIAELGTKWFQVQDPVTGAVGFVNIAYVTK